MSIRISTDDLNKIKANASKAGLSQSEYVTRCCLGQRVVVIDDLKDILRELKAIGNNINQLTVLANMSKIRVINLDGVSNALAQIGSTIREFQERR